MKFDDLYKEIKEPDINNTKEFFEENNNICLIGSSDVYSVVNNHGEYILVGEDLSFNSINEIESYIKNRYDDITQTLDEELDIIKFTYNNYHHDPEPKILVLDDNYKKGYLLGYNLNYCKSTKDRKALTNKINSIFTIAKNAKKSKLDIYKEIKAQYPEAEKYIRTYSKKHIKDIYIKKGPNWKRTVKV